MCHSMSLDMSRPPATERKDQILQAAIEIIASDGYANLSMRALARASGMKLGALQYHFRTWEDLLHALAAFIAEEYERAFDALTENSTSPGLRETVRFLLFDTPADATLQADRLFPQLWAMAQDEPVVQELLDETYCRYLDMLESAFVEAGCRDPRAAARRAGREALLGIAKNSGVFRSKAQLLVLGRRCERSARGVERNDGVL